MNSFFKHFRAVFWSTLALLILPAAGREVHAERLPVQVFTSADGLGSGFVNSIMRDSRGFLWFCTRDGLSRFDGSNFVTYQVGEKNSSPNIFQMLESREGPYFVLTSSGVYRFDLNAPIIRSSYGTFRLSFAGEVTGVDTGCLFQDSKGSIWVGGESLNRLEQDDGKLSLQKVDLGLPINPAIQFWIYSITEGQDGSLWLATAWGVVRRLPDGHVIYYRVDAALTDFFSSLLSDHDGRIWAGRESAIYLIKPESSRDLNWPEMVKTYDLGKSEEVHAAAQFHLPEPPGKVIKYSGPGIPFGPKYFCQTNDGRIWISVGDQVLEFDGQTFQLHSAAQGVIKGVTTIAEDNTGNLWLAGVGGAMRLNRRGMTKYDVADGLKDSEILALNESIDGKLYAVTSNFYLSQFDGNRFQTIHPQIHSNAGSLSHANPIFQDHTGAWWVLTNEKLYRFAATRNFNDLARQRPLGVYTSGDGVSGDVIAHIFEDAKGDLWISTRGPSKPQFGLSRWDRASEKFHSFSEAEGLPQDNVPSAFAEDGKGNLWLGMFDGGLARYAVGRFTMFSQADGMPRGGVRDLLLDRQNRLWVATTQAGLSRIEDPGAARPHFVTYNTDNGLASNNVRSLVEDLYGNIYAGTARGVDKLSPDATRIEHYSVKDGLAGDFVNVAFRDRGGALWFGTPTGLSRIVPKSDSSPSPPRVWLGGLRIAGDNRPLPALGTAEISNLELGPAQNNLQIDFFAIDFKAGETLRYQYKLEGADQNWSTPTIEHTVSFANLAPGRYRFMVRAVIAGAAAETQPAVLSFRVLPPIWQRWWFLALAFLAFGAVAHAAYRYRLAQMLKVERIRTRIATDLHDDIGASLSRMAILSEVVKTQRGNGGQQSARMLTDIADSARELVDSMGDIVWSIDPRRDDLQSVVRRIRQFASDVLEAKGIDWQLHVPPEVEAIKLDPGERQHLFLIFKEGINNVARHGDGTKSVSLSIAVTGRQLVGEIKDDGCGFLPKGPEEERSKGRGGNGLPNMRERASQLRGRLDIASSPGAGTKLTLRMPIK